MMLEDFLNKLQNDKTNNKYTFISDNVIINFKIYYFYDQILYDINGGISGCCTRKRFLNQIFEYNLQEEFQFFLEQKILEKL